MAIGRCIRSIVSPWSISSRCEILSKDLHCRTPRVNASIMFTACLADVSIKLATLYSLHQALTSSDVTCRPSKSLWKEKSNQDYLLSIATVTLDNSDLISDDYKREPGIANVSVLQELLVPFHESQEAAAVVYGVAQQTNI